MKNKRPRIANKILKNKIRELTLPDIKTYVIAALIKIEQYLWKNRKIDRWNWIVGPEIDPSEYNQPVFDKGEKAVQWGKKVWQVVLEKPDMQMQAKL